MKVVIYALSLSVAFAGGYLAHNYIEQAVIERETTVTYIDLDVAEDAFEVVWSAALAQYLGGEAEVVLPLGRADVVTDTLAIEVDRSHKWKEGLGQSLYYAEATGLKPVVALMGVPSDEVIEVLLEIGVDVMVLE